MSDQEKEYVVTRLWRVRATSAVEAVEKATPGTHTDVRSMEARDWEFLEGGISPEAHAATLFKPPEDIVD